MPSPSHVLRMESLERRENPAAVAPAVGAAWADTSALTLSFAPDGTPVGAGASALSSLMQSAGKPAEWQREVLRAFQTWAAVTNANVAVVADGGQAFGVGGNRQGDNRFGDLRVGAIPLSDDSLANAVPSLPAVGTWSGDVLFNSNKPFTVGQSANTFDVFTTALHEAGHVFGLDHSTDPLSAVSGQYTGAKAGLTASDAARVQAVYGKRPPDLYEGAKGNGTFQTATDLTPVKSLLSSLTSSLTSLLTSALTTTSTTVGTDLSRTKYVNLTGDLTAAGDVDVYTFRVPGRTQRAEVTLSTAGLSAAAAVLEVYDANGVLVARSGPADPLAPRDATFTLPVSSKDAQYFVRVLSPAADAFAVGRYALSINLEATAAAAVSKESLADRGTNDWLLTATALPARSSGSATRYGTTALLEGAKDVDYYRLTAPTVDVPDALQIQLWTANAGGVMPTVEVYNLFGGRLSAQVLESKGNKLTVQVLGVSRGAKYSVAVRSPAGRDASGEYGLSAEFTRPVARGLTELATGVFTALAPRETGTLTVESTRLVNLSFSVAPLPKNAAAKMRLTAADGQLVGEWQADPLTGQATASEILRAGVYTVELFVTGTNGQDLPSVGYWLFGSINSDPIGPTAPATGTLPGTTSPPTSPPPPPPPAYTYTGGTRPTTTTVGYGYKS